MALSEFQFNLLSCEYITPRVKHFIGKIESETPWNFIPGQFITIIFEHDQKILRRSYSIANSPQDNIIEFAAAFVEGGPGSQFLFNLKPGDSFKITGPFGRLVLKEDECLRYLLVGTGTGITPYRSMLPTIFDKIKTHPQLTVEIIEGVSVAEEVLFEKDFLNANQIRPNVKFTAAISREKIEKPHCHHGRVQSVLKEKNLNPETDLVYLCGNPQMIDDTTQMLQDIGFPIQRIVREKYISR
jgi:ferredoxin-NADP reductase